MDFNLEPIQRLRTEAANRAKMERTELVQAYNDAVADDVNSTEGQRRELEARVADHNKWIEKHIARLEALLPRVLGSLTTYEEKRSAYQSQISTVLRETAQVSISTLWGRRTDGQRDPSAFKAAVAGAKNRLGQARGLSGALDRLFKQVEVELVALEKRGFGQPPSPAPLVDPPPAPGDSVVVLTNNTELKPRPKRMLG